MNTWLEMLWKKPEDEIKCDSVMLEVISLRSKLVIVRFISQRSKVVIVGFI